MSLDSFAGINFDDPELKNIIDYNALKILEKYYILYFIYLNNTAKIRLRAVSLCYRLDILM